MLVNLAESEYVWGRLYLTKMSWIMYYKVTVWKRLSSAETEENCTLAILMYHVLCYIINTMDDDQYWHSPQNELKSIFKLHFKSKWRETNFCCITHVVSKLKGSFLCLLMVWRVPWMYRTIYTNIQKCPRLANSLYWAMSKTLAL